MSNVTPTVNSNISETNHVPRWFGYFSTCLFFWGLTSSSDLVITLRFIRQIVFALSGFSKSLNTVFVYSQRHKRTVKVFKVNAFQFYDSLSFLKHPCT